MVAEASTSVPSALAAGDVHLWSTSLDRSPAEVARMRQTLSPDELERADRFRFEKDRTAFVSARATLRRILAGYLSIDPASLQFGYGAHGKPFIEGEPDGLTFNVSHSHALAVYAVGRNRKIGVDVEHIRPDYAGEDIARRFFAPGEVDRLLALAPEQRAVGFFLCWTRKEAYIKARGEGLSHPLARFEVSLTPGQPAALLETLDDPDEAARWDLRDVETPEGYVAAVAVEGKDWRLVTMGESTVE